MDKPPQEQGHYFYPELFGHPGEPNIGQSVIRVPTLGNDDPQSCRADPAGIGKGGTPRGRRLAGAPDVGAPATGIANHH
jgi:hypothetical protein